VKGNSLLYVVYYEFGTTINSWIALDYCNMGTGLGNGGEGESNMGTGWRNGVEGGESNLGTDEEGTDEGGTDEECLA